MFEDEVTFRTLETRALQGLTSGWAASGAVVATGAACLERDQLESDGDERRHGLAEVPSASLVDRLSAPSARRERPLLGGRPGGTVRRLLDARAPRPSCEPGGDADAPVDVVCDRLWGLWGPDHE